MKSPTGQNISLKNIKCIPSTYFSENLWMAVFTSKRFMFFKIIMPFTYFAATVD